MKKSKYASEWERETALSAHRVDQVRKRKRSGTVDAIFNRGIGERLVAKGNAAQLFAPDDPDGYASEQRATGAALIAAADDDLRLDAEPYRGSGGEVILSNFELRDTLASPGLAAVEASAARSHLAHTAGHETDNTLAMAVDAADTIDAKNSLEKMMAHQMAAAHNAAMNLVGRALKESDTIEAARLTNASARMMAAYQDAFLALARVRRGGQQVVQVQYVRVENGGKAVVAGKATGGRQARRKGGAG
jgi:hypothetical protein